MTKKSCFFVILIAAIFLEYTVAFSQYRQPSIEADQKVGLGFQTTYPFFGFSLKYKMTESFSLQGILGIFFVTKVTGLRALYHFTSTESHTTYGFGQFGKYSITGNQIGDDFDWEEITEDIFGYGLGLGLEYHFDKVQGNIPLWMNLEVGYGNLKFKEVEFKAQAITLGGGLHYYF